MPNPGATAGLAPFEREAINALVQVPDYALRKAISQQQRAPLVVEAFAAFEEMFYLLLSWTEGGNYPHLRLSSVGPRQHRMMMDLIVQSPQFTHAPDTAVGPSGPVVWTPTQRPCEIKRPTSSISLEAERPPLHRNDTDIGLDQTVTFAVMGTVWELDDCPTSSLQCRSFRNRMRTSESPAKADVSSKMISNIAATMDAGDLPSDIWLVPDCDDEQEDEASRSGSPQRRSAEGGAGGAEGGEASPACSRRPPGEEGEARGAHAFILQAQSPVFRGMLAAPMAEASERRVRMTGVRPRELDDFLAAVYGFGVPAELQEDEPRLLSLLSVADRYGLVAVRDECASLLETRITEANMAALLQVADRHQTMGLRAAALSFIAGRLERVSAVMDTDDRSVRRSLREFLSDAESCYSKHSAVVDLKMGVTLTV